MQNHSEFQTLERRSWIATIRGYTSAIAKGVETEET